ncbi:MAG: hypothetical protein KF708_02495 [Pirellulales bacterium]|nr:hypothetical protein [Pirellulales bacterium]
MMVAAGSERGQKYRVWLVGFGEWEPERWSDVPPESVAIEAAEEGWLSVDEAAVFVRSFNTAMLTHPKRVWAIPVPVVVRYEGDLTAGQTVEAEAVDVRPLKKAARGIGW